MWTAEKLRILFDYRLRRVISSIMPPDLPECDFPEEAEWRLSHTDRHLRREIMIILSGETSCSLNGKTYRGVPGTVLFANTGERHDNLYYPGNKASAHLWIYLRPDCIHSQGDGFREGKFFVENRHICRNRRIVDGVHAAWDAATGTSRPEEALFRLLSQLDLFLLDLASSPDGLEAIGTPQAIAVEKARSHLDTHFGKDSGIPFLASLAGYSPVHFQRLFRQYTGLKVSDYLDRIRVRRFQELDGISQRKAIAEELGFSSTCALDNWLRRVKDRGFFPEKKIR